MQQLLATLRGKLKGDWRNLIFALGLRGGGLLFSFLFTLLVVRTQGANGYGAFVLSLSVSTFFILLGKAGLDLLLLKKIGLFQAKRESARTRPFYRNLIKKLLWLNLGVTVLYLFLAKPIALYYSNSPEMVTPLLVSVFYVLPSVLYIVHGEALRAAHQPLRYVFINFFGLYFFNILIFGGLWLLGIRALFLAIVAHAVSCTFLMLFSLWWWKDTLETFPENSEKDDSPVFRPAWPYFSANTTMFLIQFVGSLTIAFFYDKTFVAKFDLSFKLANLISMPLFATSSFAAGKITEHYYSKNKDKLQRFVRKLFFMNGGIGFVVFAVLFFFGEWLLVHVFNEDFAGCGPALSILSFAYLLNTFAGSTDLMLQLTGNENLFQRIMFVGAIVNVTISVFLVPRLGIVGAAWGFVACMTLINGLCLYTIRMKTGIKMWPW